MLQNKAFQRTFDPAESLLPQSPVCLKRRLAESLGSVAICGQVKWGLANGSRWWCAQGNLVGIGGVAANISFVVDGW